MSAKLYRLSATNNRTGEKRVVGIFNSYLRLHDFIERAPDWVDLSVRAIGSQHLLKAM